MAALAARRAELGLVADSTDLGELESCFLREDPLVAVVAPDDPLAGVELSATALALRDHLIACTESTVDSPPRRAG